MKENMLKCLKVPNSDGLQPNSNGFQPHSNGLQQNKIKIKLKKTISGCTEPRLTGAESAAKEAEELHKRQRLRRHVHAPKMVKPNRKMLNHVN